MTPPFPRPAGHTNPAQQPARQLKEAPAGLDGGLVVLVVLDLVPRRPQWTVGFAKTTYKKQKNPQVNNEVDLGICGAPPGTRTPNPLVKSRPEPLSGGVE
jgi:hypothetical protein